MQPTRDGMAELPRPMALGALPLRLCAVVDTLIEWRRRYRSRRQLRMLSDHMCKDIGISRTDAWREGSKPFWKP